MPSKPIDYRNTIIYKLVCRDTSVTDIYVGHTTNFTIRKNCHKHRCSDPLNDHFQTLVYHFIRRHGGFIKWDMIEIEKYSCRKKLEALKRERYFIEVLKSTLNTQTPGKTKSECVQEKQLYDFAYRKQNQEKIKDYKSEYQARNKNRIKEHKSAYYEANKDYFKQYYDKNKEKISQQDKKRYYAKQNAKKRSYMMKTFKTGIPTPRRLHFQDLQG